MNGENEELKLSKIIHPKASVILISSLFLRHRNLGQIDLSIIQNQKLVIYEVKSSQAGVRRLYKGDQIRRLRASAKYLSLHLNIDTELKIIAKR